MAVDMFLKISSVEGESKDSKHAKWTDIESFAWGATQPGSMATGGGGGTGKASFNDLHVICRIDRAAPTVMKHCATGKHLDKVEISVNKAGGEQVEYSKITLEDVLVTSVQYTGEKDGDAMMVSYSFQGAKVKQQYWEQSDKGTKGAESVVGYDIKQNKATA
ncbi:Hcp family type VI secretion system effector [Taylorella equigenitalis]|uniref:Uncharacterized protein ImpD n=3 Tax=Taylorella equigenitalis TaxID=29575 RepID=A0A654KGR6_TAYEM|nr:type VI secretion system tube protein Hcp [Taylorella equigenitalis]ADU91658.1 Uncharacterized protein ImpD [Taylorella equigenitalis MCE9]AFN35198.1 hypothetical protein KUI_0094 [Taylorella equigenitalis ATCC 35865]ASY29894.1 Hcp1 family type VI secretion system effector [Taylorella equigenitalis]ASY37199.1 Hcp1 family type VI secretion system effector [Taylorella equigenitalis]ASY38641.1 Hcp1 family type VI secretion system effector [Taylorella equigenitalis]